MVDWRGTTLREWLEVCAVVLEAGAAGLFVPDHVKVKDRFDTAHLSCAVALGAARGAFGAVALGPLVARVGGGLDEHVLSMLDAVSDGEVVACLGIGDRNARLEHEISGLGWPVPSVRWEALCRVAQRCVDRGWETYAATDRVEFADALPAGVGVHVQHALQEHFNGRDRALGVFSDPNAGLLASAVNGGFKWVCLAQQPGEAGSAFGRRIAEQVQRSS